MTSPVHREIESSRGVFERTYRDDVTGRVFSGYHAAPGSETGAQAASYVVSVGP